MKDLVIIGASAAGSAAAIYGARRNLDFAVIAKDTGGEVALSGEVSNWPGVIHTTGIELSKSFTEHVKSYDVKIDEGFGVEKIEQIDNYHRVTAKDSMGKELVYETKAVIIASGIHPREIKVPGEEEYKGKGVTYCTVCDGPLFKGKVTATIGGGNSALESALMMGELAKKVYLLTKFADTKENNGGFPPGENILIDKVKAHKNIEVIYGANTKEILGDGKMVSGIKYEDKATGEEKSIECKGIMIHIGMVPNSKFVDCAEKTEIGEIKVDIKCKTSCEGVFAAGDVTSVPYKQIAIAAGHGVTSALSAIEYINRWESKK